LCTVAETPRKPEHCVAWALFAIQKSLANPDSMVVRDVWELRFGTDANLDKDDPDHMLFLFEQAAQRAKRFAIEGVTLQLTSGVVKRIIPAIASTNAIIAAACANEAWKYLSYGSRLLDTYMMYNGTQGVYSHSFQYERKENCPVCTSSQQPVSAPAKQTLRAFMDMIQPLFQLSKPSLTAPKRSLYMQKPDSLRAKTEPNLGLALDALIQSGDVITVTDPVYPMGKALELRVTLT
jgi:ubiquitin-activating enzyme E1 C